MISTQVQTEGGFQNAFIFAEHDVSTAPLWDDHKATTATASGIRDCTHFADGGDARALWTRLLLALLARGT